MSENIIEVKQLTKSFYGNVVLNEIDLSVKNGEFLTLLGPSGCGKTTLLRTISGFETPDQGEIFIDNVNVKLLPPNQRHVNTVFQSYALFPHMTIFENVAFGLRCKKLPNSLILQKVEQALAIVRLENHKKKKPEQLSGGQQQRVAIARAIVNEPLVLLFDEPLSSLDYRLRKNMQVELRQLQRKLGITFIFVTHDQEEALSMSDRVAVMRDGKIMQLGTPRQVYEQPNCLSVAQFIGEVNVFNLMVQSANEKTITVNFDGSPLTLKNTRHFASGDNVNIIVRPEDLRVLDRSEVQEGANHMLKGAVHEVIYKGSTVDLIVKLESGRMIAATEFFDEDDEDLAYTIGESVWLDWMHGWEVILPHEE